jgi:FixJ family two-component response regulator
MCVTKADRDVETGVSMTGQRRSIVIVEDDAGMSKAIGRLLRVAGFHAVVFPSAEALLETDAADSADCFVLDIHLPGLSGFELRRRLGALGHEAPVIFITAHDEASTRKEAERLGCRAYFRKPFNGHALLQAIRLVLGESAEPI